ncbi:MAG: methyl-accepting chemotaxis protein [Aquabacterium sp.]|uniref:methyl-accepting chemotaxis protein n=1 Tax=Aquabacterium sp. TaxID=1872578 RepID=UPI003BDBE2E3
MHWFANFKLRSKLMLAFAGVLMAMSLLGFVSMSSMSAVNDASQEISDHWLASEALVAKMRASAGDVRGFEGQHILSTEASDIAKYDQQINGLVDDLRKSIDAYAAFATTPQDKALLEDFKSAWASFWQVSQSMLSLSRENKNDEARVLMTGPTHQEYLRIIETLNRLQEFNVKGGMQASEHADNLYHKAFLFSMIGVMAVFAIGLVVAWAIAGQIARPLEQTVTVLNAVAQGDLSSRIDVNRQDEIGHIQRALSTMVDNLAGMVRQVRAGADSVATASSQIAQGNSDLSARTESQASSLQQTAASVEEMAGTVRTNADNARQANQLASAASEVAARGGDMVSEVVQTMNGIQSSSQKISDIIGVIDGIAFQTNILALNAAVEAARAGEQGRGFAVVAGEVRTLAQRSAQAAREIKTLINDSVEKVNAGSQLVGAAGNTMSDIVTQVRKVTDLVGEIAHASTEQSQGIGQINQAVSQLDQSTQQNAALVEESMAAAESLKSQAQKLAESVAVFRVRDDGSMARSVTPLQASVAAPAPQPAQASKAKALTTPKPSAAPKQLSKPTSSANKALPAIPAPPASKPASAVDDSDWETF